jgi:uncharacterized membrane protein YeiH
MNHLLEHFGVAVAAISGVLAARGKRVDLFGVVVLALVAALGGGTLRDLVLHKPDVFWIADATYVLTAIATAVAAFFAGRQLRAETVLKPLAVADAAALALFTILGAAKGLTYGAGPVNAVVLGVVTGVAGGIARDVLVGDIPLVFRPEIYLYATAAFAGAAAFVAIECLWPGGHVARWVGVGGILALRLAAIQWRWSLPVFLSEDSRDAGRLASAATK